MAQQAAQHGEINNDEVTSPPRLPPAPDPGKDMGVVPSIKLLSIDDDTIPEHIDIFKLTAPAALKMLCRNVDELVRLTGDIPPTPPIGTVNRMLDTSGAPSRAAWDSDKIRRMSGASPLQGPNNTEHIDGVPLTKAALGCPEAHQSETVQIVGGNSEPLHIQHGAIARKFFSKKPPPVATEDYLLRMHRYCPLSVAVYLAASLYIHRLAVVDRLLPVTPRNVHRLLLAALRVAMKALEDLRWGHSRFAKVGGVSELELGRLEISFCYMTSFELKVDEKALQQEAEDLKSGNRYGKGLGSFNPRLPVGKHRKRLSQTIIT